MNWPDLQQLVEAVPTDQPLDLAGEFARAPAGGALRLAPELEATRAERQAGAILAEMEKNKDAAGNPGGRGAPIVRSHDETTHPKLSDLGTSNSQSHQPRVQFEHG